MPRLESVIQRALVETTKGAALVFALNLLAILSLHLAPTCAIHDFGKGPATRATRHRFRDLPDLLLNLGPRNVTGYDFENPAPGGH